jgi:CHAD domain-containing protein
VEAGRVVLAVRPQLTASMSSDAALRAIVACCLAQILPNAADVAAGVGGAEHLHQLRVGLRRLRSALRVFGDGSKDTDAAWLPQAAAIFSQLGATRDRDMITETVLPELRRAGSPLVELPAQGDAPDAADALRGVDFNLFMLQADAQAFDTADDLQRHRARKRLKRLRYSIEFLASLHSASSVKVWLESIRAAQDRLGRYNDLAVAEQAFRAHADVDPRAWFCVGWLAARREQLVPETAAALQQLAQPPKLRRKGK